MADVGAAASQPWAESAAADVGASVAQPWNDGTAAGGVGGPLVPGGTFPGPPGSTPPAEPPLLLVAQTTYEVVHTVTVTDERTSTPVELKRLSISVDDGSIVYALTADAPGSLFVSMTDPALDPPVLRVSIDGIEFLFLIEGVRRARSFGRDDISLTGRSTTVLAGEPYSFTQNWVNDGPSSAAQLVLAAQLYTALAVNWLLPDWLVPDKVWTFSGAPLAVASRVAEAVGAIVTSDRTAYEITITPRYPSMPNEWVVSQADVGVVIDAVSTESYERADKPAYNAIYVSGQQQGVVGLVVLDGTQGDKLAPLVTDLLLTDADAVRERGVSILGASGPQARVTLVLPVLVSGSNPGILRLGQVVRVDEGALRWWGMVRAVRVDVDLPTVMQAVTLERHTSLVPGTYTTTLP